MSGPASALAQPYGTETVCAHCGAQLVADQEWCLDCGAAVDTRIRAAPDWRVPAAIVAGVTVLAAVVLVFSLISLSNSSDQSAAGAVAAASAAGATSRTSYAASAAATRSATTTATPATTTATPATSTAGIASWPTGLTGYTVVLNVVPGKAAARASARKIAATGIPVGLLFSSDYTSMRPGDWIVFSGTYTTETQAKAAATTLQGKGQPGAYSFSVVPAPGH